MVISGCMRGRVVLLTLSVLNSLGLRLLDPLNVCFVAFDSSQSIAGVDQKPK